MSLRREDIAIIDDSMDILRTYRIESHLNMVLDELNEGHGAI